jgi:AcrR family transcriptional regulator
MGRSSKEDKVFSIALKVFELEEEKGHLGWKTTEVVERSGVSRSLIYRYFGGNKEEILIEAVKAFILRFYGFDNEEGETFLEKLQSARRLLEDYPQAAMFYLKWRTTDSFIKDEFIKTEKKYQALLKEANPNLTDAEILAFHTCLHGFVTAPFLESGKIPEVFSAFLSLGKSLQ